MHDGKNVWDDHDCCFGHTGWEVNVTLDAEIAAHHVAPVIVVAADQTPNRNDEYGLDPATMATFIDFQLNDIQPKALEMVRGDGRLYIAGSSLGGLVSMELALRHPQTYTGVASLSGAFWPGMDTNTALRDEIPGMGKQPLAIYVDSGGDVPTDSDGAADTVEVRDLLVNLGWQRADSPACTAGPDAICYFIQPDAQHDELAWKARAWRFLRFLVPPT
jgi:pimeloyl-ACP methyl ester carboxylesterase